MSQPEFPAPTTSTRLPAKAVADLYALEWMSSPSKHPSNDGTLGSLRVPLATITPACRWVVPPATTSQVPSPTGLAEVTSAPKV